MDKRFAVPARARALIILCTGLGVIAPVLNRSEADSSGQIARRSPTIVGQRVIR